MEQIKAEGVAQGSAWFLAKERRWFQLGALLLSALPRGTNALNPQKSAVKAVAAAYGLKQADVRRALTAYHLTR